MILARFFPLVGRFFIAALFLGSGLNKLGAPTDTIGYINYSGLPLPTLAYVGAIIIEVVGGILLLVGFRAQVVAAALAVFTILTAIVFHSNFADQNQMIHFMKNLAIVGGLLQIVAFGAGAFSVDSRSGHRASNAVAS